MKTSGIPWYVYLALSLICGVGGIAGKQRLDAMPNPTMRVAIFIAIACLLALIFFLKGMTRLFRTRAKN